MVMCFTSLYLHTELLLRKCQRKQLAKLWQQELNVNVGIFFLLFPNRPRCCKWPTQKNCPELGLFGSFTLYFSVKQCLAAACESTCVLHLLILKTFNLPLRFTALKITADTFVSASKLWRIGILLPKCSWPQCCGCALESACTSMWPPAYTLIKAWRKLQLHFSHGKDLKRKPAW